MSTRPTPPTPTTRLPPHTASNADRLSQVLAAGLERQLSLETCRPCKRQPAQRLRQTAATDLVVDYKSEAQLRAAGARRLELDDGVPWDPISFDDFERADGRERDSSRVMILGCGHAFTLRTVQRHNQGRSRPVCPRMREHQTADRNYYLTAVERTELGLTSNPDPNPNPTDWSEFDGLVRITNANGDVLVYRDEPDGRVLVGKILSLRGYAVFYEGPRDQERMVRKTSASGAVFYYEGSQGQEHMVRRDWTNLLGTLVVDFYEGPRGQEIKVRREYFNGTVEFYEGPQGQEHGVRKNYPDGQMEFYEGPQGEEHLVRAEYPDGQMEFYEGPRFQEHVVRTTFADGQAQFYEGPRDEEHVVRKTLPDGAVQFYEGPQGQEHMVRKTLPNGNVQFYEGPQGQEHMVRVTTANGQVSFYEGTRNQERLVRKTFPNGREEFYEGLSGQERLVNQ